MTIADFANTFNNSIYIVATGSHVVAIFHGDYYDAWDSGGEVVTYFFERR